MRVACVDIGSNTTRLLVCEGDRGALPGALRPVGGDRAFTRGLDPGALAAVVCDQVAAARAAGVDALRVVGTAALRADRAAYEHLRLAVDAEVELLAPGDEARLAYLGAARHREGDALVAVVDVGGGSTEVAMGRSAGALELAASVPLGSAVLTEAHLPGDPPTPGQLDAAATVAAEALREVAGSARPEVALAAGGSATTLGRLIGSDLAPERLDAVLAGLVDRPSAELAAERGIDPRRARLLPAGLLLLRAAGDVLGTPLRLGAGGLREGICLELLARSG